MNNLVSVKPPAVTEVSTTAYALGTKFSLSTSSVGGIYTVQVPAEPSLATAQIADDNIENAVYGHIRAIRALGRTRIDTSEIANALGISISQVHKTLESLKKKGVRLAR